MAKKTIHTINARDNCFFDVYRQNTNLSNNDLNLGILKLHERLVETLSSKDIKYNNLRTALQPSIDRYEAAFIFDTSNINEPFYGYEVFDYLLPHLKNKSRFSIFHGDFIPRQNVDLKDELERSLIKAKDYKFIHATQLYCIYINNLTPKRLKDLDQALKAYPPYIGYINTTFESLMKTYISFTLSTAFIKYEKIVILPHEDDYEDNLIEKRNYNTLGLPFEKHGFTIKSVPNFLYMLFLHYKIERRIFNKFDGDTEISLISISSNHHPLDQLSVEIEEDKLEYLKKKKAGSMRLGQILEYDVKKLANLIISKIKENYIYNLQYREEHKTSSFNVKLEIKLDGMSYPMRLNVALTYEAESQSLKLITLY